MSMYNINYSYYILYIDINYSYYILYIDIDYSCIIYKKKDIRIINVNV